MRLSLIERTPITGDDRYPRGLIFSCLALLAFLSLLALALLPLWSGLVQAAVHRFHAAHEVSRVVERLAERVLLLLGSSRQCNY